MNPPFKQKLVSLISLFALITNLIPLHARPVLAAAPAAVSMAEPQLPVVDTHPRPTIVSHEAPLSPTGIRATKILPSWFNPPETTPLDLTTVAGLALARPALLANLPEWPLPPREPAALPAAEILPAWFSSPAEANRIVPLTGDLGRRVGVLPGWFDEAVEAKALNPLTEADRGQAGVLPAWFQHKPELSSDFASLPSEVNILPTWFTSPAVGEEAIFSNPNPGPTSNVLPAWFKPHPINDSNRLPTGLPVPPQIQLAAPLLAPIPGLQVSPDAPDSVSAGNFFGDAYTVTIRNTSSLTAFNFSISATIPANGFTYIGGSGSLVSSINGAVAIGDNYTHPQVTWTPVSAFNLAPDEVLTLTFQMTTDGNAVSGQRLDVDAIYENPVGMPARSNGGINITVGRGNLVISKSPTVQDATFGDTLNWTIEVANTGLGDVFSATMTDTIGLGYTNVDFSNLPDMVIPVLAVGERRSFAVTATVNACDNLTNIAQAYWSIGNDEGHGTAANPISDTVDIAYLLEAPNISLSSNSLNFEYCTPTPQTVVVTMTNSAGPARNVALSSNLPGLPFSVGSAPGWNYNPGTGVFSYTDNGGTLTDTQIILSFIVTPTFDVCSGAGGNGAFNFVAQVTDACDLPYSGPSTSVDYTYGAGEQPGLSLSKSSSASAAFAGDTFDFFVDFNAQNVQNINGDIVITDIIPAVFSVTSVSAPIGTITQNGNAVTWTMASGAGPGDLSNQLTIGVEVRDDDTGCGTNDVHTNIAQGSAAVTCPGCPALAASASVDVIVQNTAGTAFPRSFSTDGQVCGLIVITNQYSVPINDWLSVVFTETMGFNDGVPGDDVPPGTLTYVTNTLAVNIDGTDVTAEVVIDQAGPQLVLDFGGISSVATGTRSITISYSLFISDDVLAGNPEFAFFDWAVFQVPGAGGSDTCQDGDTFFQGVPITLQRANLDISISPESFVGCASVPVTLTVFDDNLVSDDLVANNIVVTFTVNSPDFDTIDLSPASFSYGGGFAANPVTLTTGVNIITWTFQNPLTQTGSTTGTISFTMTRSCEAPPLAAGVQFDDRCDVTHDNTATNNNAVATPDVRLFVTPDQFTVNENKVFWRIYVTNVGAGTAGRVLITNTMGTGLRFVSNTTTLPSQLQLLSSAPFVPGEDILWEVSNLAPGQQIRLDVFADVVGCGDLLSNITINSACLDGSCASSDSESLEFLLPPVAVRSSNAQTADLPFCDTGEVILTVKNASVSAHIYQLVITETLNALTYLAGSTRITVTNKNGTAYAGLTNVSFEPVISIAGSNETLVWSLNNPGLNLTQTTILTDRLAEDSIVIRYEVRTDCDSPGNNAVIASAGGLEPCGTFFFRDESAVTLDTIEPDITLTKQGRNVTQGEVQFVDTVNGEPGDTIEWRIVANNAAAAYVAQNAVLTDTLPPNMSGLPTASSATGVVTPSLGQVVWNIGDLPADGVDRVLLITGTVDSLANTCQVDTANEARLVYGCDNGCRAEPIDASAQLRTRPALTVQFPALADLNICGGGPITLILTNDGPPAYNVVLTDTLPAGFVYESTAFSNPAPAATVDLGQSVVFTWNVLPSGVSTISFQVANSSTTGACSTPINGPNNVTLVYDDHPICTATISQTAITSTNLTVVAPNLTVSKTPVFTVADPGDVITWVITVDNSGPGDAFNLLVTDTLSAAFSDFGAGPGSTGETPTIDAGNRTITWFINVLPVSVWTATVTGTVSNVGGSLNNNVTVAGSCDSGCTHTTISDTAFASLVSNFAKNPPLQTATIGSLAVFTLDVGISGIDFNYENLVLTDTLPPGLGYVASRLVFVADTDGSSGGPFTTTITEPPITPGLYSSGDVVWQPISPIISGEVSVNVVITTVILDIPSSTVGTRWTNNFQFTYNELDQPFTFVFTDDADVDIVEPILHLGKSYLTTSGCDATLFQDNFNAGLAAGWINSFGTSNWSVNNGLYIEDTQNTTIRRSRNINVSGADATDYSLSTMMRMLPNPNDLDNAEIGITLHHLDDNNYYRVRIRPTTAGGGGRMLLEKRVGGGVQQTIVDLPGVGYIPGAWHHLEARIEQGRIRLYLDGVQTIDVVDTDIPTGPAGLLKRNGIAQFDDVLVTRLDQTGCFVGANDLVTYTLTISNQASLLGYDLVITDALPTGMSLVTFTFESNDPASALTAQPAPGATGVLSWGVDQLNPTDPFDPLNHTAITLSLVLRVADTITANTILDNQAFLSYDSQTGNGPVGLERDYSGGSHSTAVRTVDDGLTKTIVFSPPPTATLGTLVTYTLIVPASPITATLYNVLVTDTLDSRFFIESVTTAAGTGGMAVINGQTVTASFTSIPHDTQAVITITTRISHEFPTPAADANNGDTITNSAVMGHATAPTITTTNVVTTEVGEPNLQLSKSVQSSTGSLTNLDGTARLTYTIRLTNTGSSPAYSIHITDSLPAGISVTNVFGGDANSGPMAGPNPLTWTVNSINNVSPANVVVLSYTARISNAASSISLTNRADILYHSLTQTVPGVRPYTNTDTATVGTPVPAVAKTTTPFSLRVGDVVTYSLVFTIPAGVVGMGANSFLVDTLPPGVRYITNSETLANTPGSVSVITTGRAVGSSGTSQVITWTFGSAIASEQSSPTVVTLTFRAQATGQPDDQWLPDQVAIDPLTNTVELIQRGQLIDQADATNQVSQPDLTIAKDSLPPSGSTVQAGDIITYSLTITNRGFAPAYDLVITDTLPAGLDFVSTASALNPASSVITPAAAGQLISYNVSQLAAGPGATMVITIVARVSNTVAANVTLTNTAALPLYDSQPGVGPQTGLTPTQRIYTDGSDDVFHRTVISAGIIKAVNPITATVGEQIVYSITFPAPPVGAVLSNVLFTDTVDSRLRIDAAVAPGSTSLNISGAQTVTATYTTIPAGQQRTVTIIATVLDLVSINRGDVITNVAEFIHAATPQPEQTNVVTTTLIEPELNITKQATPNTGVPGDLLTYALAVSHPATSNADAFDVVISDTLPLGLDYNPGSQQSSPMANSFSQNESTLVWRFTTIAQGTTVLLTYTIRISDIVQPGQTLTNVATTTWTSTAGPNPDERTGADGHGGSVDDYADETSESVSSSGTVTLTKQLATVDSTRTISGTVPYSMVIELPLGTINNLIVTDTLAAGLIYNNDAGFSGGSAALALPPAQSLSSPNDGTAPLTVVWQFGNVTNPASEPQPSRLIITFTATVANQSGVTDTERLDNDAIATWTDAGGSHTIVDPIDLDDAITVEVPALVVAKTAAPVRVTPGSLVTWTVVVTNAGTGPAFEVDLTDALPDTFFSYDPGSSFLNGSPTADPVINGLDLFWGLNQSLFGGASFSLTYRTLLNQATPQGVYTNVVTATNGLDEEGNPIPPDNGDHVPGDSDPDDSDSATVLVTLLDVTKSVADTTLVPGQSTTYTIQIDNPGGTVLTLTVTDTLPAAFSYAGSAQVNGVPDEPDINTPPVLIWNTLPQLNPGQSLFITFRVSATTEVNGVYTNTVQAIADDGTNTITDTDQATTTLVTNSGVVITKTRLTPSPVPQGSLVVFDLTIQNTGNTTLFSMPLVDTFDPNRLQFGSASIAPNSTTPAGTLTWNDLTTSPIFGDLGPGLARSVVLTFTALHVPGGGDTTNSVRVTGVDTNTTIVTDTDTATVSIQSPNLQLDKSVSPSGVVSPGDTLNYSLCYFNNGTLDATNVVMTDIIPANTTYMPGSAFTNTGTVEFFDGVVWSITEPITVTALRWLVGDVPADGQTHCAGFDVTVNMTVNDPTSNLSLQFSRAGWIVLAGDPTGLDIIGYTGAPTPTVPVTPTSTVTATPLISTPTVTTPVVTITATPVPTPTITPTIAVTPISTPIPTVTIDLTPAPSPTLTGTSTVPVTETPTFVPTPTLSPTTSQPGQPPATATLTTPPSLEPAPANTPTPEPVETPTPAPNSTPTLEPTITSTATGEALGALRVLPANALDQAQRLVQQAVLWLPVFQDQITPTIAPSMTTTTTPTPSVVPTTNVAPTPTLTSTTPAVPSPTVTVTATITTTLEPAPTPTATLVTVTPVLTSTPVVMLTPVISPTPVLTATPVPPVIQEPTSTLTPTPAITVSQPATNTSLTAGLPIIGLGAVTIDIVNAASINSDQTPPLMDTATTPVLRVVDPAITKEANPTDARPGDIVNFFILAEILPSSNANATNIVVQDVLPYQLDLVTFTVSSPPGISPPTVVVNTSVTTGSITLINHPRGITQAVVTTITLNIPILEPGQQVRLDLETRVNDTAIQPETIRNVALLNANEGSTDDETPINIPLPPSNDDDDDDDDRLPPSEPALTPAAPVPPAATLPALYLPETGYREKQTGAGHRVYLFLALLGAGSLIVLYVWKKKAARD